MDPEHIEFFGNAIHGAAGDLFDDADAMVRIDYFFTYTKFHITSGKYHFTSEWPP
jgi:hypothetical protein